MLKTKLVSCMKFTKDRMDNPMAVAEMNQLLDIIKTTGATHVEVATVIGHPNFSAHSKQWADTIHSKGMKVTWRCAHQNMEGLYNAPKYVGAARKPQQWWIDEVVNAFNGIRSSVVAGDEEAIYPERTEGIFQDATSFLSPNSPDNYGAFFVALHNALKMFPWTVGLSANNASELMSGWMPRVLSDTYGQVVIDHYRDNDVPLYESEVRAMSTKYGKPVYVQEGAPDRFTKPTRIQCDNYYAANKRMAESGILEGFGSWSGWEGAPESIVDKVNGQYQLNDHGKSLQSWWAGAVVPTPTPEPTPIPTPTPQPPAGTGEMVVNGWGTTTAFVVITNKGNIWVRSSGTWKKTPAPTFS